MEQEKSVWQSKTLWVNLVMAVSAFFPAVQQYIANSPEVLMSAFAVVNIILRFVTKDKVVLTKKRPKAL